MNILFFLTPKSEVIYVNEEDTVGQAMDTMEKYKYSAVPIITKAGRYAGTLTEGDLLWGLKNKTDLVQKGLEKGGARDACGSEKCRGVHNQRQWCFQNRRTGQY